MARFVFGNNGVIAKTVTQFAPTSTTVQSLFAVTQAKGIAMPIVMLANVTNASISYRLAVAKGSNGATVASAAVQYYASDVTLSSATPPYYLPIADLEQGDAVFIRTNTANALNVHLLGYEVS